jgi:3-hydroxyisobutyrate dehydrogenase-like beta-hydroxyacid dehydrogenase
MDVRMLGLGEAGGRIAADLVAAGVEVRGYDPAVGSVPDGVLRADDPASAVEGGSLVLAATTGATAVAAAESVLAALGEDTVYADMNTASPALKRELAALVEGSGARFADIGLLGPVRGIGTPVLASGAGASAFAELMRPLGMPVEVVSQRAGDAAEMKLLRSVFMKGLGASVVESLEAARAAGHEAWLEREIAEIIGESFLRRLIEGSDRHAVRRVDEMEAACALLLDLGVEPRIARASALLLASLAERSAAGA